jgi:ssDNA-binding Zn-finger/Zn-ribbon topoisomerase 1
LCNKSDLAIICALELNDSSHKAANRAERDTFLLNACKSAGVPLVQIPARNIYSLNDIREHLAGYIKEEVRPATPEDQKASQEIPKDKLCPKCSSGMVKRVAKQGPNAGKEFWACSAYPKCKQAVAIDA